MDSVYKRENALDTDTLLEAIDKIPQAFEQLGFSSFRDGQEEPAYSILSGTDTILCLATGGGKSAVFTIPALTLGWKVLVFSPLIALMNDQVSGLRDKGVHAACLSSDMMDTMNTMTLQDWSEGRLQMLYIAPERMGQAQFQHVMKENPPDLVVIDEAHVLSSWSSYFRPSYQRCGDFIKEYNPKVVAAFTGTATDEIVGDIKTILHLSQCKVYNNVTSRPNLKLKSFKVSDAELFEHAYSHLAKGLSTIVYGITVRQVEDFFTFVKRKSMADRSELNVVYYHGQMTNTADKQYNQEAFMSGKADVIVATNAFGMGIDKADIRCIIHLGMPGSLEALSQEIGRAGRDGEESFCYAYQTQGARSMQDYMWDVSFPDKHAVRRVYQYLLRHQDAKGIIYKTVTDIERDLGSKGLSYIPNYLETKGVIARTIVEAKVSVITLHKDSTTIKWWPDLKAAIVNCGQEIEANKYRVDLRLVADAVRKTMTTLTTNLKNAYKDGVLTFTTPFSGKSTRFLRELKEEDLEDAEACRKRESEKIAGVRQYYNIHGSESKHKYLTNYFTLNKNG